MFARWNARLTVITSTSSSSTSRMFSARSSIGHVPMRADRPGEEEGRPIAFARLDPGAAAMRLHDLSHHRQSDTSALQLVAPLERLKQGPDLVLELGGDSDAIVA